MTVATQTTKIIRARTSQLFPHPDNRPLGINDEKVEQLAEMMQANGYDESKPLKVRPLPDAPDAFQIIEGEHRWRAAQKAGIESVPVYVIHVDDEEALIQLVAGNVQTDNHPLDIGIAALELTEKYSRTNGGKHLGERIGKSKSSISLSRSAAKVWRCAKRFNRLNLLTDISSLYNISTCLESDWLWFHDLAAQKDLNKADVIEISKRIRAIDAAVTEHAPAVFDITEIKKEVATAKERIFKERLSLIEAVEECAGKLQEVAHLFRYNHKDAAVEQYDLPARQHLLDILTNLKDLDRTTVFRHYDNTLKRIRQETKEAAEADLAYYQNEENRKEAEERERAEWEAFMPEPGTWYEVGRHRLYCGDNRDEAFLNGLPEKVAFAFADPPYNADTEDWDSGFVWEQDYLAEVADIVAVTPGIGNIDGFFKATAMPYKWSLSTWIKNGMTRGAVGFGNWMFTAVFSRLESIHQNAQDFAAVTIKTSDSEDHFHKGHKPKEYIAWLLNLFTSEGDVVVDNFLGSGTTLLECEKINRTCYGAEIDPKYCKEIIKQFKNLQADENEV